MTQEERIARNHAQFREANESIRAKVDAHQAPMAKIPFLCECPREDCTELAPMAIEEYANMRSHPTFFVNAPGHEAVKGENDVVVERTEAYVIVDKAGPSRDLVIGDWAGREQR